MTRLIKYQSCHSILRKRPPIALLLMIPVRQVSYHLLHFDSWRSKDWYELKDAFSEMTELQKISITWYCSSYAYVLFTQDNIEIERSLLLFRTDKLPSGLLERWATGNETFDDNLPMSGSSRMSSKIAVHRYAPHHPWHRRGGQGRCEELSP
jgi:hypothetical protein